MMTDEHAHLVLVTALRVVDDTALLSKAIVQELMVRGGCLLMRPRMNWQFHLGEQQPCEGGEHMPTEADCCYTMHMHGAAMLLHKAHHQSGGCGGVGDQSIRSSCVAGHAGTWQPAPVAAQHNGGGGAASQARARIHAGGCVGQRRGRRG